MFLNKLRPWFKKGGAPSSKTCNFDSIDGEAHSNGSGFSDRTLAECYKSILPKRHWNNHVGQIEQSSVKHPS